jgi:hypothetical protein
MNVESLEKISHYIVLKRNKRIIIKFYGFRRGVIKKSRPLGSEVALSLFYIHIQTLKKKATLAFESLKSVFL